MFCLSRTTRQAAGSASRRVRLHGAISAPMIAAAFWSPAFAQTTLDADCDAALPCTIDDRVIYPPAFFSQYNPITALDMVRRVPGFSIDSGDNVRGFGGAAGNVLINGQRPSTKSASIFDTLSRIGAGNVERIELIRGGTGGLDVSGQAVVVNVVRKSGGGREPAPWEFSLIKRRPDGGVRPTGEISYSGKIGDTKYTVGAEAFGISLQFEGEEQITRFDGGDDEFRTRDGAFREHSGGVNLRLEHPFANGDTARFSFEGGSGRFRDAFVETRFLAVGGPDLATFEFIEDGLEFEIGGDYEHAFTENFGSKLIALYGRETESFTNDFQFSPAAGVEEQSIFSADTTEGEIIGRIELDWRGWKGHSIQFGGEFARNFIDSEAELLVDDGSGGGLTPVIISGANTRVRELRGEMFVNDSWSLAPKWTLDLGFALELSSIAQSGDQANSRFFTYPKPSATLTYSLNEKTQLRLSGAREVNQLSFGEFVSSVNFDDEDVDFGNPDLQPQRTWAVEGSLERRFGELGVITLTGFLDYVQDVEDLLPIGGIVEVPGNIGDGKIFGGSLEMTAPLDWLGLKNALLEAEATIRESSVTDPVTGEQRDFSFTPNNFFEVEFRQDFPASKVSWGWEVGNRSEELGFGLDELSRFTRQMEIRAFIETTAIKGVKARFEVNDIANVTNFRERTVFGGSRDVNPPIFQEFRRSNNGGAFRLILSGAL